MSLMKLLGLVRTLIWSLSTGHAPPINAIVHCPCDGGSAPFPPLGVRENYVCSQFTAGHLWSGTDCTSDNPCCFFHNHSYLSVATTSFTNY